MRRPAVLLFLPALGVLNACHVAEPAPPVDSTPRRAPASAAPGCPTEDEITAALPEKDRAKAFPSRIHCADGWASAAYDMDLGGKDEQGNTIYDTVPGMFRFEGGSWHQVDRDGACTALDPDSELYASACVGS